MNLLNLILSGIVSGTMSYFSIKNLSKNKFNVKNMLTYVLILIPLLLVVYICFDGITRLLLNIIFTIMALYLTIFKKDISNSVYYALSYELLAYICEIIISVIFVSIFKINMNSYKEFQFSLLIFSICNCIFIYLLSKNRFICKSVRRLNEIIKRNNKEWIYILIIMIILSLLLVFNNNNLGYGIDYYINAGMVIFVVFSLIYVIYNKFQKQAIEDKYNESMEYVLRYEKIINDQGKKNHEYNNQLMVIKGYINNPERLSEYLDEVIGEHKTGQNYTVKQLGFLPDGGVKGLLYHKLSKMEDNNIKYYLYVDQNLKDKDIENSEIETFSSKESDKFIQTAMVYYKK